jgi:hypothetical protein
MREMSGELKSGVYHAEQLSDRKNSIDHVSGRIPALYRNWEAELPYVK